MNLYDFNRRHLKFTRVLVVWVYTLPDVYENSDCFILCYHMIVNFTHSSRFLGFVFSCCLYFCLLDIWNVSVKGACLLACFACFACLCWLVSGEIILLFKLALSSWAQSSNPQPASGIIGTAFKCQQHLALSFSLNSLYIIYVSLLHICIPYVCVCVVCVLLVFIHMSYNLLNKTLSLFNKYWVLSILPIKYLNILQLWLDV